MSDRLICNYLIDLVLLRERREDGAVSNIKLSYQLSNMRDNMMETRGIHFQK